MAGTWFGGSYFGDATNEAVHGTSSNESLYGAEGDDQLFGEGGNDIVDGGVGNDVVDGGDGNDVLYDLTSIPFGFTGLIGHDTLRGGAGDDQLVFNSVDTGDRADGGAGDDLLTLRFNYFASDPLGAGLRINFTLGPNGATSILQLNSIDTLVVSNIERLYLIGGANDDSVTGGVLNDSIYGGDGNDHLYAGAGDDWIDGGKGIQDMNGGAGFDVASFDTSAVSTAMTITNTNLLDFGTGGTVRNFEAFYSVITGAGADTFTISQSTGVYLNSGAGDDTITVGDGGANISAGLGNDVIVTGAANDVVDGGDGNNLVHMGDGDDQYDHSDSRGWLGLESIYGEAGNDLIFTSDGSDRTYGGSGNDTIYNGRGTDQTYGGIGNDVLFGENGADSIYGGDGNDALNGDTDPELGFTAQDNDVLEGGNGDDFLSGGIGADLLYGGAGNDGIGIGLYNFGGVGETLDTLLDHAFGGTGNDTLFVTGLGNNGNSNEFEVILAPLTLIKVNGVTVADATGMEALTVNSYGLGHSLIEGGDLSDFVLSGYGDETVRTFGGNDTVNSYFGTDQFYLGDGDDRMQAWIGGKDRFYGGAGNDGVGLSAPRLDEVLEAGIGIIDGGTGDDTLTIYGSDRGFSFSGGAIFLGGVKVANVTGFEHVLIYGQSTNDSISGSLGADTLAGGFGNDTLLGLDGNDSLDGSYNDDLLYGGNGDDLLVSGSGLDSQYGGNGNDRFTLVTDGLVDLISGGNDTDLLTLPFQSTAPIVMTGDLQTGAVIRIGGVQQATVNGIESVLITGTAGNDSLLGGSGNDSIGTGGGADTVSTGAGDDLVTDAINAGLPDVIDLGAGIDTIQLFSSDPGDVRFVLSANMVVLLNGVATGSVIGAEIANFYGSFGDDLLVGGALNDVLSGSNGANTLRGLDGDDTLSISGDALADQIFGGNGTDQFTFYGGTQAVSVDVSVPGTVTIKAGTTLVATLTSVEVLNLIGSDQRDILRGLDLGDTLYGFGGNDMIYGGAGDDQITGSYGADILVGGGGADHFHYYSTNDGGDTIRDFSSGDIMQLSAFGFGGGMVAGGSVTLVANHNPGVPGGFTGGVFLYDTDTGALSYDRDGAGVGAALLLATLLNGGVAATLTVDQFILE